MGIVAKAQRGTGMTRERRFRAFANNLNVASIAREVGSAAADPRATVPILARMRPTCADGYNVGE